LNASIDSLWQEDLVFYKSPQVNFENRKVWYDELYLPVYNSWKYFEILGNSSKGSYLGVFNFIQIENYQFKVNPSHFEFEVGKADGNLIHKEQMKSQVLDWKFLPDHLKVDHPNLAERNVITPNSNYKSLSGLGTTTISGVILLNTKSYMGGRAGYKWILGEKWMIEPSANYIISWNENTFYSINEINNSRAIGRTTEIIANEEVATSLLRNMFLNVRFGYSM